MTETIKFIVFKDALWLKHKGSFFLYSTTTGFLFDLSGKGLSKRVEFGRIFVRKFVILGTNEGKLCIKAGAINITL